VSANKQMLILFGGTDGKAYYNDLWVFDDTQSRWILVTPQGEQAKGPEPRAFAGMVWAQNGRKAADPNGDATFRRNAIDSEFDSDVDPKNARPAVYMFGGRGGTMPSSRDTDSDLVEDGTEFELGGTPAARDPRWNKLVHTNMPESIPFAFNRMGSMPFSAVLPRGAIANFESLRHDEGGFAAVTRVPVEYHPDAQSQIHWAFGASELGVDAERPEQTSLWWHRYGGENPFDPRDVWQLGIPNNTSIGSNAAPRYAYSGRWCYGTDLDGTYPNGAIMELYSPIMNLSIPPGEGVSTSTNYANSYFLMFHEWVNLAGSGDVIRVEALRPGTPADILNRKTALNKPIITVVPSRNSSGNTSGTWRRVIAPLDSLANEQNVYFRFTLQSDSNGVAGGWYVDDVAVLQGAQLCGTFANASNAEVVLYGVNFNNHIQATTFTDTNGFWQFGLLPLGQYSVGAIAGSLGPFTVDDPNTKVDAGVTNIQDLIISSILGAPTSVSWPTAPGLEYRIEFTTNILSGIWTPLSTLTAGSTNETYLDYVPNVSKVYRVIVTGAP
jgi:hypothetical protein